LRLGLLSHHDAETAAPAFRKTDARHFDFRGEVSEERAGGRMKPERGCNQIDERGSRLQIDSGEVTKAGKIALLEMAMDLKPVASGLEGKMNMFAGLQFENREAAGASDGEEIENAVFAPGVGEDLRIDKARIERRVNASHILANEGLEPALGLNAIERVPRIASDTMAIDFKFMDKAF